MSTLAERLVHMSVFNPEFVYNVENERDRLLDKIRVAKTNGEDFSIYGKLYNELSSKRPPFINLEYVEPFIVFCSMRHFDYIKFVKRYKLSNVLACRKFLIELQKVCSSIMSLEVINLGDTICHNIFEDFQKAYNNPNNQERMWDLAHILQVAIVRGISKGTVTRSGVATEIGVLNQLSNHRREVCGKLFTGNELVKALDNIDAEDYFIQDGAKYREIMQNRKNNYLAQGENELYNNLNAKMLGIKFSGFEEPKDLLEEFILLNVLNLPKEYMCYHSSTELSKAYGSITDYLDAFNSEVIKNQVWQSLIDEGEGLTRYTSGTTDENYLDKNLKILGAYNILTKEEIRLWRQQLLGGIR